MAHSNRDNTLRVTLSGMLLAVMLVLGYVESLLPSPGIPGIKLGLSNSILIFAVYMLDVPTAYILMALKVLLSGLMFGGVSTMIYAFAGGLLSLTGMVLLRKIPGLHPVVVSMAGGLLHNTGQVVTAMVILHTPEQMLAYLGILMLTGLFCGLLTGTAASAVMRHLKRIAWHAPASSSKGLIPVILALLLIAGGLYYAWRQTVFTDTAEIRIETTAPAEVQRRGQPSLLMGKIRTAVQPETAPLFFFHSILSGIIPQGLCTGPGTPWRSAPRTHPSPCPLQQSCPRHPGPAGTLSWKASPYPAGDPRCNRRR
ncbi:MAG TPA: hypothetical protein DCP98_07985 [Sphaerochaeta sp.]|nr:hypothetical protein [Sphaerochaeta sp.]